MQHRSMGGGGGKLGIIHDSCLRLPTHVQCTPDRLQIDWLRVACSGSHTDDGVFMVHIQGLCCLYLKK